MHNVRLWVIRFASRLTYIEYEWKLISKKNNKKGLHLYMSRKYLNLNKILLKNEQFFIQKVNVQKKRWLSHE